MLWKILSLFALAYLIWRITRPTASPSSEAQSSESKAKESALEKCPHCGVYHTADTPCRCAGDKK